MPSEVVESETSHLWSLLHIIFFCQSHFFGPNFILFFQISHSLSTLNEEGHKFSNANGALHLLNTVFFFLPEQNFTQ